MAENETRFIHFVIIFNVSFEYQPNVLFLPFCRQRRHKSRERKRKNLQTIVSVNCKEWKSPLILCLIGKCLKAQFFWSGVGGRGKCLKVQLFWVFFWGGGLHLQYLIKITTSCIENLPN